MELEIDRGGWSWKRSCSRMRQTGCDCAVVPVPVREFMTSEEAAAEVVPRSCGPLERSPFSQKQQKSSRFDGGLDCDMDPPKNREWLRVRPKEADVNA